MTWLLICLGCCAAASVIVLGPLIYFTPELPLARLR